MNVKCPKCGADYNVQSDRIPLSGIDMKCTKCLHSFHVAPGNDDGIVPPSTTRLGLKGVTFLGGGDQGGGASSGFYIRSVRGQVMGPFESNVILQMLRTSQLTGAETLSRDKQSWEPLTSVEDFADFIAMRQDKGAGSTRFLGRPGSPERDAAPASRLGGAVIVPPAPSPAAMDDGPGFSLEFDEPAGGGAGSFEFDDGGMPGVEEFSLEMGSGRDPELSGFALSDMSAELPTPLGAGGRYENAEMDLGFVMEDDFGGSMGFDAELPVLMGGGLDDDFMDAELPAAVGDELPDPFMDDDAELPVLSSARMRPSDAELPIPRAARRSDAELPIPVGFADDAELPVLAGSGGDIELPSPVRGGEAFGEVIGRTAELPRSAGGRTAELPRSAGGGGAPLPASAGGAPLPKSAGGAPLPKSAGVGASLPRSAGGVGAPLPTSAGGRAELPTSAGLEELPVDFEADLPASAAALPAVVGGAVALGTFGRRSPDAELPRARASVEVDDDLFSDNFSDDPFAEGFGSAELPSFSLEADGFSDHEDMTHAGGAAYQSAFGVGDTSESTVGVSPDEYHSVMGLSGGEDEVAVDASYWGDELEGGGSEAPSSAPLPPPAAHRVLDTRPRDEPTKTAPTSGRAEPAPPAAEEASARGTQARKGSSSNKMLVGAIGILALALVLIGGMILGQTDMGYFGLNLLTGGDKPAVPTPEVEPPPEVVEAPTTTADFSRLEPDTNDVFVAFVADKSKALSNRPNDAGIKGELLVGATLYLAHYPGQQEYASQAQALGPQLKDAEVPGARFGRGAFAVLNGKVDDAQKELDPLTKDEEHAYMAHLLLGLSDLMASRVEGVQAMAPPPEEEPQADGEKADGEKADDDKADGDAAGGDGEKADGEGGDGEGADAPDAGGAVEADSDGGAAEGDAAAEGSDEFDMTEEVLQESKESQRRKMSITHLEEAARLKPKAPAPRFFLAMMALAVGEDKPAMKHLDEAIAASAEHVPGMLERARLAYLTADLKTAEKYATPVVETLASKASVRERSMAYQLVGQVHVARRESEPAVAMLTESLKVDPTNVAALKELGQEFFRNQQYTEALNYFTTNAQLSKSDPEVLLSIVKSHIGLEQYDQAVKMLEQGAQSFPTDAQFPYYLGRIHDQRSNWFEAQQNYRKALAIDPGYAKARVRLAILLLRDNRNDDAREQLVETEKLGVSNNAEMAVDVGTAYMLLGEEDKGLGLLKRAMRLNASNLDARLALAQFYLNKQDPKRAMEMLGPFVDSKSDDIQLTLLLADAFRESGQYERSIEQLDRLIERDPKSAIYRFKRGMAYFAWQNFDTAREQFLKAYSLDPSYQRAYFYAGRVSFEQKDYAAAMKIFRQVLDEEPAEGEYRYYLGYALEKNGNLTQALEEYNNVERFSPKYGEVQPDLYYRRGRILQMEGNYRAAKQDLIRVLQNDPKHLGALLGLGDTLFDERKYADAISLYEKALLIRDELPRAHYQVGRAYAYLNRRTEAVKALERAIELGLEEPKAYETLGYLHRDNGSASQARKAFDKYLEIAPDASNKKDIERELKRLGG